MKIIPHEEYLGEGSQVILAAGDSLDDVPESHRDIITPEVRVAFKDPRGYFRAVADRAPVRSFGKWLEALTAGTWELILADWYPNGRYTTYGFRWRTPDISTGFFRPGPHTKEESVGHADFRPLYSVIRRIHWAGPFDAGGLSEPADTDSLAGSGLPEKAPDFPPKTTTVFGRTESGDLFVHNAVGRAGCISYENGEGYVIGSIPEMLDRMFGILMKGRTPQFEYDPKKR